MKEIVTILMLLIFSALPFISYSQAIKTNEIVTDKDEKVSTTISLFKTHDNRNYMIFFKDVGQLTPKEIRRIAIEQITNSKFLPDKKPVAFVTSKTGILNWTGFSFDKQEADFLPAEKQCSVDEVKSFFPEFKSGESAIEISR